MQSWAEAGPASSGSPGRSGAPLCNLVYRSRAVNDLSAGQLRQLTLNSEERNRRESITGIVVYDDSRFFQWLEGPRDSLSRVMCSIRNDPRHTDIEVLSERTSSQRAFGAWNMKLAAAGSGRAPWGHEMIEAPSDLVCELRLRPTSAPALLAKLVPERRPAPGTEPAGPATGHDDAMLGGSTAQTLKQVILTALSQATGLESGVVRLHPRARELAELLVEADQAAARELIEELNRAEVSITPLYANLLEPAARSLGDLWAQEGCSEFEVTLGLCRILAAARLLGAIEPPHGGRETSGATVLIAPEPGELHHLGAALDEDILWRAGWAPQCEYPTDDRTLQELVSATWFDVVDLSLSAAFQRADWLPRLTKSIADMRRASRNPHLLVVVGGRVFVDRKASAAQVGADLACTTSADIGRLIAQAVSGQRARRLDA
nr:BLUF domain-containing protein [Aquibium carbonis]